LKYFEISVFFYISKRSVTSCISSFNSKTRAGHALYPLSLYTQTQRYRLTVYYTLPVKSPSAYYVQNYA